MMQQEQGLFLTIQSSNCKMIDCKNNVMINQLLFGLIFLSGTLCSRSSCEAEIWEVDEATKEIY